MNMKTNALLVLPITAMMLLAGCASSTAPAAPPEAPVTADADLTAMLPTKIRESGVLNVGIAPSFYPNAYFPAGSEELSGVDPDLLGAMGEKLGLEIKFVTADFPSLVLGVNSGKFDIAMSDISDTQERQEQVTFVDYILSHRMVYVPADNPKGISGDPLSLCGLTVPVVTSTLSGKAVERASATCVAADKPEIEVIAVQGHEAVQLAVDSGRADFGMTAGSEGAAFDKVSPGKYEHWLLEGEPAVPSGIATQKDAAELQEALLATLTVLQEEGTYVDILTEYHLAESALEQFGINLG